MGSMLLLTNPVTLTTGIGTLALTVGGMAAGMLLGNKYLESQEAGFAGLFKSEQKDVQVSLLERGMDIVLGKKGWRSVPLGLLTGTAIGIASGLPIATIGTYGLAGAAGLGLAGIKWLPGKAFEA
jgi:hypothetical protein